MSKENPLENRLRLLYALQVVDLGLDELTDRKGDLPHVVRELTEKVLTMTAHKAELEATAKKSRMQRDAADVEIIELKEKIEKYKSQQFQVKTNKQYDLLTREIDAAQERVAKLTRELETLEGTSETAKSDAESITPEIDSLQSDLTERQAELDAVNLEHEEEESKLKHEREKIVVRVSKGDLATYEKIRKAKGGKAVVPVKRSACGGCYNRVPPQKVLELRKHDAILMCERCGRIIVSDEIVQMAGSPL
jgi:uncharacterized protein